MVTRWGQALAAGIVLGLAALATNLPLDAWGASGETAATVLLTASKVVNSGTAWAGLGVLAGWLVGRPPRRPATVTSRPAARTGGTPHAQSHSVHAQQHIPQPHGHTSTRRTMAAAALAAVLASEVALVVHYAVGQAIGHFDASIWWANKSWFVAAIVMGAPMGAVGAATRRHDAPGFDTLGLVARLVTPAGAVVEPLLRGFFRPAPAAAHSTQDASTAAGAILVAAGVTGLVAVTLTTRHQRRTGDARRVAETTH